MKMLRFGGPNLPQGMQTWYDTPHPTEQGRHVQLHAKPGQVVPADQVMRHVGNDESGAAILEPNADYFVTTGRAEYVDEPVAVDSGEKRKKSKE